jgi:PAS domain S-box-containing protein
MNRKLAEETISQAQHAQRTIAQAILENAPIGIAKLNKNLQFNEVNSAFSRQFGVSSDNLPGKSIFEVTTGIPVEALLEVVGEGTTFQVENVQIVFEGVPTESIAQDTCWDLAAWPIRDTSGVITGVILITANVTERAQLARQRDDFVATLTHDLKNPLLGQNRMLELFIAGTLGSLQANQIEMMTLIKTSTSEMLELIGNLLEIYRYDAGAQQLHLENCDAKELVDTCIAQARPLAERKGIKLNSTVNGTIIVGDRTAIRRVIMNLLDNAIKFARHETDVEVWCETTEKASVLHVKDNGQGIHKQQLSILFQRFGQTEFGRSFSAGTGLGLYLCRQIVEGHGGTITCESEVGVGTIFSVSLPRYGNGLDCDSSSTLNIQARLS